MNQEDTFARSLALAKLAAREGGAVLKGGLGRASRVTHKGFRDLVTELDVASQNKILGLIRESFPDHRILAEEGAAEYDLSGPTWIVDPLDGTTNFVHGLPIYCVSIGLAMDGVLKVGVVYDPERDELFSALAGQGSWLNDDPIQTTDTDQLSQALVVTGFAYDLEEHLDSDLRRIGRMLTRTQGIRRLGSAALDLAYVACGRMDAFWEEGLHPWDLAGGALLVEQAGGRLSALDGSAFDLVSGHIIASNGPLHDRMVEGLGG